MINKPTLEQVTTCLDVINWAIDDLDIKHNDSVVTLYKVLADKEREFKQRNHNQMEYHLAAVIQAQEQDTKKPDFRVNFAE